jgi:hypothetical protein
LVLIFAVIVGLIAGSLRAWISGKKLQILSLRHVWLVPIAYTPQLLSFELRATRKLIPDEIAALGLLVSLLLLLVFAWLNRDQPGFWALGLGLALNLVVIALNGGLMPISPETVHRLEPYVPPGAWKVGERLGFTKDIVLPVAETRLWALSDRFVIPEWYLAFSIGDVFIAIGAFWLLWSLGGGRKTANMTE